MDVDRWWLMKRLRCVEHAGRGQCSTSSTSWRRSTRQKARGEPGAVGAICRREGLYSSLITRWRQQRDDGARGALVERPPGPRAPNRLTLEHDRYRQRAMLAEQQLETAEELIEAQGKALALLQRFARKSAMPRRPSGQNG